MLEKPSIEPMLDELMVQQQINNSWEHMVAVIMLNQTNRKVVKRVLPIFLHYFPNSDTLINSDERFVKNILQPLGLVNTRYNRLIRMTQDYFDWDGIDARKLYGIGKYGNDSYQIFFKNDYTVEPTDKELVRYLKEKCEYN